MKFSFDFKFIRIIISIILSTHLCAVNAADAPKNAKHDIAMRQAIKSYLGYCAAQKNKNNKRDCYSLKPRILEWSDLNRKPRELDAEELNEMGASLTNELALSKISVYYFYLKNRVPASLFIPYFEDLYKYLITHNKHEYTSVMRQMIAALHRNPAIRFDATPLTDWENFNKREYILYHGTGHWSFFKIFKKQGQVFFSYSATRPYVLLDQTFVVSDEDALNITKFIKEKKLSNICFKVLTNDQGWSDITFTLYDCQTLQGNSNYLKMENTNTSKPTVVPVEVDDSLGGEYFVGTYTLLKGE